MLLVVVLALGVSSRLPRLGDPPLTYHPTRQYLSGLLARDFLATIDPHAVNVSPEVAAASRLPLIEPPIMETLSVGGFLVTGEQSWWLPRTLSIGFWAAAAAVVFLIGRRCQEPAAGIVGAAVLMLNPGTTEVARSFQPESLLVFCIALATLLLLGGSEPNASRPARVGAALVVGLAVLVKITAALVLLPVAALAARRWWRQGRRAVIGALGVVALLPTVLYYAYGFFWGGFLTNQAGGRILPRLLGQGWFWRSWGSTLLVVVPMGLLAIGVLGAWVARPALRQVVVALLAGYLVLGLTFTYHISSHDYYSAPIILPVALGAGAAADGLLRRLDGTRFRHLAVSSLIASTVLAGASQATIARRVPSSLAQVAISQEVGAALAPGSRAVMLAPFYGYLLHFYAGMSGPSWPYAVDLRYERLQGMHPMQVQERLRDLEKGGTQYFVVTDLAELDRQPSLKAALGHLPLHGEGKGWRIYDLPGTDRR